MLGNALPRNSLGGAYATITLPDDIEQALEQFVAEQAVPVQLTAVVQSAVREYLGEPDDLPSPAVLRIRPGPHEIVIGLRLAPSLEAVAPYVLQVLPGARSLDEFTHLDPLPVELRGEFHPCRAVNRRRFPRPQ